MFRNKIAEGKYLRDGNRKGIENMFSEEEQATVRTVIRECRRKVKEIQKVKEVV